MSPQYCDICHRWLPHDIALSDHLHDSPNHPACAFCNTPFGSFSALSEHYDRNHYCCDVCNIVCEDADELLDHGDYEHFVCRTCIKTFSTSDALATHNVSVHFYCRDCNRLFISAANLAAHRGSSLHAPRSFTCPGRLCGRSFVSISALILHAESGTCRSGVTRKIVNAQMAKIDHQNVITNPARMIAGGTSYSSDHEPEYWATELSWNGSVYKCILCPAGFRMLSSLNQHLQSPRHLQKMYRCPKQGCNLQFTVLSALCQHVETGSCGVRQTRMVQDAVENLTRGMKAITF